jgi:hypothetical protein
LVFELIPENYIHAALSTISWYVPVGAREAITLSFKDLTAIIVNKTSLPYLLRIDLSLLVVLSKPHQVLLPIL